MSAAAKPPQISVVVIGYRMRRELPRTVASLAPAYQHLDPQHYEIELAEMPSDETLTEADRAGFPTNLRYTLESENFPLPVAINRAVRRTRGTHVLICVDGARILSAGILQRARQTIRISQRAVMAVHGRHLGRRPQQVAVPDGTHSAAIEDGLLESIDFPNRPPQLFNVSCWAGSSRRGWFGPMAESCALMVPRELFEALGGYDEAITLPGGGLANCDFYTRVLSEQGRPLVVPLGEATFHQHHGGTTTSAKVRGAGETLKAAFEQETGRPFVLAPERPPVYLGTLPRLMQPTALDSMIATLRSEDNQRPTDGAKVLAQITAQRPEALPHQAPRAPMTLVVGMHRSGTSFLARQMVRNGFVVPGTPMAGSARSNPEGHYEPLELVAWHNDLLSRLGLSWSALGPTGLETRSAAFIDHHARTLQHLLVALDAGGREAEGGEAEGETAPIGNGAGWVLKDPRICRTVPVWQRAAARMGVAPTHLLVLRDPTRVAESLSRRDGFGLDFARVLWARYVQGMLPLARSADDLLCLDGADADTVSAYVARRTGRAEFCCQPVLSTELSPARDQLTLLYRAFLESRDLEAFRAGIDAELAFLDRYPGVVARLDRLAGFPDA
ncbi:hypothetical protein [Acuticoccus sp. I52.16.1]|uniref:hypothetical protein n=1 Tax=Acuticoccus sp. I52.16.1 TaxID=2928472 RepID=UPI001FD4E9EF|nr:hypothetical protein [Acuticoccus sp. I52.16.1]UOM37206.1 hypothetical protein MRB58_23885 [Acuticoccus sp. I52.16.1]